MRFGPTFFALAWLLAACEGSHHDLGQDTSSATTGGGGAGGGTGGGGGAGGAGGAPAPQEPDLPPKLTVVNGIVDRDELQLCFLESPPSASDDAEPWPGSPLSYATAMTNPPVPSATDVEVLILTGDTSDAGSASCREIADDPTGFGQLEVVSAGVLPGTSLSMQRSLLFAVLGCFGGEGHEAATQNLLCGETYTPLTPTPSVLVTPLSRITLADAVGIQVVNGVGSGVTIDAYLRPSFDGVSETPIMTLIPPGAAAPYPPSFAFTAAELGSAPDANARIVASSASATMEELTLGDAMEAGGITSAAFSNGKNVTLVAVGPTPASGSGAWWNAFALVAIASDPE